MSASGPGNARRGPGEMTPLLLLLLLALAACLAGTVHCQTEDDYAEPAGGEDPTEPNDYDVTTFLVSPSPSEAIPTTDPTAPPESTSVGDDSTHELGSGEGDDVSLESRSLGEVNEDDNTEAPDADNSLSPTIIILIPVVLVIVIIGMVVGGIVINRRWNRRMSSPDGNTKEDPYLDGNSTEKVPMPMFEEDIPSVLELEMEDLEQWMNKDGGAGGDGGHGI